MRPLLGSDGHRFNVITVLEYSSEWKKSCAMLELRSKLVPGHHRRTILTMTENA